MKQTIKLGLAALLVLALGVGLATAKTKPDKAWLGVYTQTVDEDIARAFDLPIDRGAIVNGVVEDSPAEKCGLQEDDIIIAVDGAKVYDQNDLVDLIGDKEPGAEVSITVMRGDKEQEFSAVIDEWRDTDDRFYFKKSPNTRSYSHYFSDEERPYIGISLLDVSQALAASLGAADRGVLINEVEKDSPAAKAGLQAGDLVVAVDGEEVADAGDVQKLIQEHEADEIARLDIIRDKKPQMVEVTVDLREGGYYSGGPHILNLPDLSHFDLRAPKMKGLHRSLDFDFGGFDSEEVQKEMEELRKELKEMQTELQELKKQLQ